MNTPIRQTPNIERRLKMYRLYTEGISLSAIGRRYGLSRQRVHQIVVRRKKRPSKPPRVGTLIYIAQCGTFIKIGITIDIPARFRSFQGGCPYPVTLLVSFPGTRADEFDLHARFADSQLWYEWYHATPDLLEFIAERRAAIDNAKKTA